MPYDNKMKGKKYDKDMEYDSKGSTPSAVQSATMSLLANKRKRKGKGMKGKGSYKSNSMSYK